MANACGSLVASVAESRMKRGIARISIRLLRISSYFCLQVLLSLLLRATPKTSRVTGHRHYYQKIEGHGP